MRNTTTMIVTSFVLSDIFCNDFLSDRLLHFLRPKLLFFSKRDSHLFKNRSGAPNLKN